MIDISSFFGGSMHGNTNPYAWKSGVDNSLGESNLYGFDSSASLIGTESDVGGMNYSLYGGFQPKDLSGGPALLIPDKKQARDRRPSQDTTYTPQDDKTEFGREPERGLFELPSYVLEATRDPKIFLAEQRAILKKNRAAYDGTSEDWKRQHHGEYVAIVDGKIVGLDADEEALIRDVREEYGYVHTFTKQIGTPYPVRQRRRPRRR